MKILHLATGFPLTYPGGITNYVVALADAQLAAGHEVGAVVGPGSRSELLPASLRLHDFESKRIPAFGLGWTQHHPDSDALRKWLAVSDYQLIHVHMVFGLSAEFLEWLPRCGIPYVISLHDYSHICPRIFMVDYQGDTCRSVDLKKCARCVGRLDQVHTLMRVQRRFGIVLPRFPSSMPAARMQTIRRLLSGAALLLPVSERVRAIYSEIVPEGRYRVVHIGNKSAHNRDYSKSASAAIRAVFIGTLDKKKGAFVLEQLVADCKRIDLKFVFHGRADRIWGPRLAALGVEMRGPYMPSDLPQIMRDADIGLVLPTWEDNGPQVVMEFINYGTPVLATRMGGIPDFVRPGTGFLFDPYTESGMASAKDFLSRLTPGRLSGMAAAISPLLSPEEHAAEMDAIYRRVQAAPVEVAA